MYEIFSLKGQGPPVKELDSIISIYSKSSLNMKTKMSLEKKGRAYTADKSKHSNARVIIFCYLFITDLDSFLFPFILPPPSLDPLYPCKRLNTTQNRV